MNEVIEKLGKIGVIPVVVIENASKAKPLAEALIKGGLPCAEVTFRTEAAEEAIKIMAENFPEMLMGAGTVLTVEQAERAVKAGAKFIVSPGFGDDVVKYCIDNNVPVVPGIATPTEIQKAMSYGLDVLKFFPAEAMGGLKVIKAVSGPYGNLKFMPTGGINAGNINEYLSFKKILACGGSWMVPKAAMAENNFDEITRLAKEAVMTVLNLKLGKVVVKKNSDTAPMLDLLSMAKCSIETGDENLLVVTTNSLERAKCYFENKGIRFDGDRMADKINDFTVILEEN